MAFASGDIDEGIARLATAIRRAVTTRQLDEALHDADLRLAVLPHGEAEIRGLRRRPPEELADTIAAQRSAIAGGGADSQLDDALSRHADAPDGTPYQTLLAVKARRYMDAGRSDEAADIYESLIDTPFAPEALVGLRRSLEVASDDHSSRGDVRAVRAIQERLSEHGWAGPAQVALATSRALLAAGNPAEAEAQLEDALAAAEEAQTKRVLHEAVASVALTRADPGVAARHLDAALALTDGDDAAYTARLEVRRAVAAAMSTDLASVAAHLRAAFDAWRDARAFDPAASLRQELSLALEETFAPAMAGTLL